MDTAYDRIQEETLPAETRASESSEAPAQNLNTEIQEAFRAVSASPWGTTLGGWFGQVRRQGESLYQDLQKEAVDASEQATKGFNSLRNSVVGRPTTAGSSTDKSVDQKMDGEAGTEAFHTDIVKEAGSLVASLRSTAAAKLKDLQKAEDAADEALLRFGLNVREFLRDAVKITGPGEGAESEVLFEATDSNGKKVFHSTRLEAQLHAIHSSPARFTRDPTGEGWRTWESSFDITSEESRIADDLERYPDLRRAYEWAVPERADYKNFWMRYYYLRQAVDEEERRRKEVLKGATDGPEEEISWDDDDEDNEKNEDTTAEAAFQGHKASGSTATLSGAPATTSDLLKPIELRRIEDEQRSVADSDASYDMMMASGTTSRVTGSPQLEATKKVKVGSSVGKDEDEEEDDWE